MLKNKNKAFSKEFIGIIYYTYNGANELEFIIKAVFKCPLAEAKRSNANTVRFSIIKIKILFFFYFLLYT